MMDAARAYLPDVIKKPIIKLLRPRIGVLYQYNQLKPYAVPRRYYSEIRLENAPVISIVTPSYNQGNFIEKTILSVLGQQYPRLEYFIQDGGSDDDTLPILQRYSTSLTGWESKPDGGQSNAINLGFQRANGEIMAYLNSDDILLPGTLAYVARYFNEHPDIDVVYGHRILIDENDHEVGRWILPPHDSNVLSWADYVPQETLFWRRGIWEKAGGKIDVNFRFAMDWDLLLRFRDAGAAFARLPRFLGAFRIHAQQKTLAQIHETGEMEMHQLRKRCAGRDVTWPEINRSVRAYRIRHLICHGLYRAGVLRY